MKEMNIGELLVRSARRYPEKTAIIFRNQRLSYQELNRRVNRMSHHLIDLGVQKGDRVGILFYNASPFVEIFYATVKIGALAVPLNFRINSREVKWCLDHMGCKVFVYDEGFSDIVDAVKKDFVAVEHLICAGQKAPPGEHHFEQLTSEGVDEEPEISLEWEDPAYILFTGGTTGAPKAAVHTHRSAFFGMMDGMFKFRILTPDDVVLTQLPLFHVAGLILMRNTLAAGGCLVLVETLEPLEIMRLIDREKATYIALLPPATFIRLLDVPNFKSFDTTSIRTVGSAVSAFPKPLMLRLLDAFPNARLTYGYGATETGGGITGDLFTRSMVERDSEKVRSIGRPYFSAEIRLVDTEGRDVPNGETGEAIVRSLSNMKEYFGQPELTAQSVKDGWFYTGDLLRKDEDGFYYFMDRKKDMIKTGGENVFAQEVEKVILSHEAVENCAVIGVPDDKFGEAVMAVVKLREGVAATEQEIVDHCKVYLSSYKKPRRVVFVDNFPISDAGKVQKFKLKEEYGRRGK